MNSSPIKPRYFIGGILVALGVLLLLSDFNVINLDWGWDFARTWWPILLVLWGLWELVSGGFRFRLWPIILVLLGIGFQLWTLDLWDWDFSLVWPVVIVIAGLALLLGGRVRRRRRRRRNSGSGRGATEAEERPNSPAAANSAPGGGFGHTWRSAYLFGGGVERVNSKDFRGGEVTAVLGGATLDLREAELYAGTATLEVTVVCGGVELRVPADWRVSLQTTTLFGGTENKRRQPAAEEAAGELTVVGTVIFGGIEIN